MIISSPLDFREAARRRLPRFLFDYADGGANEERTLAWNRDDLTGIALRQKVLYDVADIDLTTSLFGRQTAMPIALGPVGIAGMYRRRGEAQVARAARRVGVPFCVSTVSICPFTEVRRASGDGALWFQLYVIRDRAFMRDLIATARETGADTLVFTVDMPVPGARYRDARSGMSGPRAPLRRMMQALAHPGWSWDVGLRGRPHQLGNLAPVLGSKSGLNDYMGWLGANFDPSISWSDIEWIRSAWQGPLIIKGILDVENAKQAVAAGADGIVVSNHGGRQLDGVLSSARALPEIAQAVRGDVTVLADSGVRSGIDVVRMLALGAEGVMLGRAWLYALAAQGERGIETLLMLIEREMRVAMALTGVRSIANINSSILAHAPAAT